ncbi:hypothetical protein BGC31_09820 [Komagataeibacter xylinus]|nr:hypothetical protein BGC31_09820 [Komagataeibacter xylinus]
MPRLQGYFQATEPAPDPVFRARPPACRFASAANHPGLSENGDFPYFYGLYAKIWRLHITK